jgi:hypothetical protein
MMYMRRALLFATVLFAASATAQQAPDQAERYESARVDGAGQLHIVTSDGREILPPKEGDQVGFDEKVSISPDRKAVAWTPLFPNCCTSYPIPHYLVLYSGGKSIKLDGSGLPVWQWRFLAGGTQIAFEQETVHGGWGVHYELHEVGSGKLLAEYDPHVNSNEQVDDKESDRPDWVIAMGQVR